MSWMSGRDFEARRSPAETQAKRAGLGCTRTHLSPGQWVGDRESAWEEAHGSMGHRYPGKTLEREKLKRVAVHPGGHEPWVDVDVGGGCNPLKRPIRGCEGAAFGCQTIRSIRSDREVAVEARPKDGSRTRGRSVERRGPSPATETLKSDPHERCGRRGRTPASEAGRGEKHQGRRNVGGAMGRGWQPDAARVPAWSATPLGREVGLHASWTASGRCARLDVLKGAGTP